MEIMQHVVIKPQRYLIASGPQSRQSEKGATAKTIVVIRRIARKIIGRDERNNRNAAIGRHLHAQNPRSAALGRGQFGPKLDRPSGIEYFFVPGRNPQPHLPGRLRDNKR